jgi:hypothetical protein
VNRLALLCLVLAGTGVDAQTVYRCGPEGRSYSQSPCPQGKAVDVSDKRSREQRSAAEARARDDQVMGDALERERRACEADQPVTATKIDGRPLPVEPPAPESTAPKQKKKKTHQTQGDDFKAVAPSTKAKRSSV